MESNYEKRIKLLPESGAIHRPVVMIGGTTQVASRTLAKRNLFVDFLVVLFGISSWIGVTSSFLQLPLIVATAPEGWSLPSYMAVTIQSANIGSFAYVLYQKYSTKKINDGYLIYIILIIGCVAAMCMAQLHQHTIEIGGKPHSVTLLVITLMFALVGCLSSVLFMPYMGRFRECYLVTYMFGMGLNGFLSSILTLIQGVGGTPECIPTNSTVGPAFTKSVQTPLFGTKIFFLVVFAILVMSTIAFILLNNLDICKKEYAAGTIGNGNEYHYDAAEKNDNDGVEIPDDVRNLSTFNYVYLMLAVVGIGGLGNGIFPGLMTFSCLPYGFAAYHFAVTLAAVANPLVCFVAMFVPHTSIRMVRVLSIIGTWLAVYIFFVALRSPYPPLLQSLLGPIFIIGAWTVFTCIINYMKISIVAIFRYQEGRTLVWVGTVNQLSSAIGSIISFVLVNYTNIFVSYEPC